MVRLKGRLVTLLDLFLLIFAGLILGVGGWALTLWLYRFVGD